MPSSHRLPRRGTEHRSSPGTSDTKPRDRTSLILAVVLLWVAVVHANGLFGSFVMDDKLLTDTPALQDFGSLGWFQITNRPVTMGSFAAHFTAFGPSPLVSHLGNLAIHLAAVACLFALVCRSLCVGNFGLSRDAAAWIAAAAALLWGVHPLTTAAVTYLIQRSESLASLGILGCLLAWSYAFAGRPRPGDPPTESTAGSRWLYLGLSIAAAFAAYGSKQMTVGLPLIVLLFDRVFIARTWKELRSRLAAYVVLTLPIVIGAGLILPRLLSPAEGRSSVGFHLEGITVWSYFTSQPRVFLEYFRLTVFPVGQSLDYGWLPSSDPRRQWLGLLGWLLIAAAIGFALKRLPKVGAIWLAALIVLAPTSSILPLQDTIFEHRVYLPLALVLTSVVAATRLASAAGCSPNASRTGALLDRGAAAFLVHNVAQRRLCVGGAHPSGRCPKSSAESPGLVCVGDDSDLRRCSRKNRVTAASDPTIRAARLFLRRNGIQVASGSRGHDVSERLCTAITPALRVGSGTLFRWKAAHRHDSSTSNDRFDRAAQRRRRGAF